MMKIITLNLHQDIFHFMKMIGCLTIRIKDI